MSRKRVVCVVGTRPEVIKMAPVVRQLRARPEAFDTVLLATAQHREMLDQMLDVFSLVPDVDLDLMQPNQSPADVTCRALAGMLDWLKTARADLLLAEGDTTTVMASAMACFYAGVPFGHVEAGLRTRDMSAPFPEEFNRRVADLAARYHFAPTERAAENLRSEAVAEEKIHVTGNTVIDALHYVLETTRPPARPVPEGVPYVLMTCHRREIFGAALREVFETVKDFARRHPEISIWYPVHPNPNVAGPAREILGEISNVALTPPLDYVAFAHAMKGARFILSDSGGVQEEAPALGKPVLVLRDKTERPEALESGCCMLVGPHRDRLKPAMERLIGDEGFYAGMSRPGSPFGDGHAAERIVSVLTRESAFPH